jgi:hypothetical protein
MVQCGRASPSAGHSRRTGVTAAVAAAVVAVAVTILPVAAGAALAVHRTHGGEGARVARVRTQAELTLQTYPAATSAVIGPFPLGSAQLELVIADQVRAVAELFVAHGYNVAWVIGRESPLPADKGWARPRADVVAALLSRDLAALGDPAKVNIRVGDQGYSVAIVTLGL